MKRILLVFTVLFLFAGQTNSSAQTTYYVSSAGNDSAAGTSDATAWKTLNKLNITGFANGDHILFRSGDIFRGTLRITSSGVTLSAYGSGSKPVISGAEPISGAWTVLSGNIWQTTLTGMPAEINNLFRADTLLNISRYPNKNINNGYLNFETTSGKTRFTDNDLSTDWSNSELVVRAERYRLVRTKVSSQSGVTVNLVSNTDIINNLTPGRGYFFRNDLRAIDQEGEWAYDPASGKVYLQSSASPVSVSFSKQDTVVIIKNADHVTITGLQIEQGNRSNLYVEGSRYFTIGSCDLLYSGGDAVYFNNTQGVVFEDNIVSKTNWNGVTTAGTCSDVVIQRNVISYIGNEAFGKSLVFYGIYNVAPGSEILSNTVSYTIGIGILACGENTHVKHNFIDHANIGLEDYGSIYTNYNVGHNTGLIIENNIIQNSPGEQLGSPADHSLAQGIYLDNGSTGVTVRNNTVLNVAGSAYFVGTYKADNILQNNTAFNAGENELQVLNPNSFPVTVKDNIFISYTTDTSHKTINFITGRVPLSQIGMFKDNYVINPFAKQTILAEYLQSGAPRDDTYSPYQWNLAAANVTGTSPGPINYALTATPSEVILFYTNPSEITASVTLPSGRYLDAKGQAYSGSVSLDPFSSIGLFKYSSVVPDTCSVPSGLATTQIKDFTAMASWNSGTDAVNYDVRYRGVDSLEWIYAYNLQDTTSLILEKLALETDYEWQMRISCFGSETAWSASQLFRTMTLPPAGVSVKELLGSSAIISWNPYKEAIGYQLRYKMTSAGAWITQDSTVETEAFLSGLTPLTAYAAGIRSKSSKGWSNWSDTLNFTTTQGGQIHRVNAASPNQWIVRNVLTDEVTFKDNPTSLFIGRVSNNQSGVAVFPIQLPTLAAGQLITGADFTERMDGPVGPVTPQLWGIPYRAASDYDLGDYYDGAYYGANQSSATLIQDPWIDVSSIESNRSYNVNLLGSGRSALKSYFETQYANGATGGKWAFLRINPNEPSTASRLLLDRSEDADAYFPAVSFILTPLSGSLPLPADSARAMASGTSVIQVSWYDRSDNESGFIIERRKAGDYYNPIDTLIAGSTAYIDSSLTADITYSYRVLAYNANGVIGYSNETSAKTSLSAPHGLGGVIKASNGTIQLSWLDSNTSETGFIIERRDTLSDFSVIGTAGANTLTYSDTTASGTSLPYLYRLRAFAPGDTSAYSASLTVTSDDFEVVTLYQAFSSVNGSAGSPPVYTNTLAVNTSLYTAPVFHPTNLTGGCYYAAQANFIQSATTYSSGLTSYMEFQLKPASGACKLRITSMEVKARKPVGESFDVKYRMAYSNDGGITYVDNGTDLVPTPVACSAAGYGTDFANLITQTWDLSDFETTNTAAGARFRIYYFNQPVGGNLGLPLITVRGSVIPVIDTLKAPVDLHAVIKGSNHAIELTWNESNDKEDGFYIERKTASGSFAAIDTVGANTVFYRDTTASMNELPYTYRIRSFAPGDTSQYSALLMVTSDDFEVITLYQAQSSVNGSAGTPPVYANTLAANTSLYSAPVFHPANLTGGCYYAAQANFIQAATAYSSGLTSYLEFKLKPDSGNKLRVTSIDVKARKAVGESFQVKYRVAYSNDGGFTYVDNGSDLIPTPVACSAAGYGTGFANLITQTWDLTDFEVSDTLAGARFRIYYFNQPGGGNMGLPLVTVKGFVIPVTAEQGLRLGQQLLQESKQTVTVSASATSGEPEMVTVHPNPVKNGQVFSLHLSNPGNAIVKMFSVAGHPVQIRTLVTGANDMNVLTQQPVIPGVYLVRIVTNRKMQVLKVVFH